MIRGDVDRAYRYISFTSDCAGRFGSRQRLSQISPLLSTIANQYKAESEENYRRLMITMGVLSVLMLLVLVLYYYANRQRQRLAVVRDDLKQSNEKLSDLNSQLSLLNEQLTASNTQLIDANRVKEEYVGRFMRMCSVYVDRLDCMRRRVNRLIKAGKYDELKELTRSTETKDQELDELYLNFDNAFLHLFPDFVDRFNELLRPKEQVQLTEKERLNTTVRIFALIRLGIDDSSKIAEFLHYSVNTIYNYRARVKNGARVDRDTFEERVKAIGTV
jgi:transcriptional regulator